MLRRNDDATRIRLDDYASRIIMINTVRDDGRDDDYGLLCPWLPWFDY